ncbi:MAG: molybdopterin-dependent oxidoreductase, partial [Acidobacteriota bacterium]|nr:molybdopterin-dependent oxidoreductase [Acidobacteriota bacterium]
ADDLLNTARHVVAIDSLAHATTEKAEVVLPAGTFAESDGTIVSNEGRAQRFFQVFVPKGDIESSWEWLRDAVFAAGRQDAAAWEHFDDIKAAMSQAMPALARAADAAPSAAFRMADSKIPREPHRYSGRTAIHAGINVSEPKPPEDPDTPFSYTMEGYPDQPPAPLVPFFWSPGWNSIQAVNKFQEEIAGPLRGGDAGVRMIEMHGETQGSETPGAGPIPEPFALRPGEQLLIPLYHIFGSEELTHHAPAVAELSPKPYIAMSPGEAARLQLQEGGEALVSINGSSMRLPVRLRESLPAGVAGLSVGLAGGEALNLPAWGKIVKA